MSQWRLLALFVVVGALCACALLYAWLASALARASRAPAARNGSRKTVLYWNEFFGVRDYGLGEGSLAGHCPRYRDCWFEARGRAPRGAEGAFDALLFHGIDGELDEGDLPTARRPEQRYVFVSLESPANRRASPRLDGYFNLTMSYLLHSDLVWTYSDLVDASDRTVVPGPGAPGRERGPGEQARVPDEILGGKRRLAVWYRSNCRTRGGREHYVAELERHMDVAKFGACSSEPGCPKSQDCFKTDVEPNYFYYLSFENSLCDDYVTEKFFHALQYYVIPVVYGGANYSRFAPPKSYINALDFDEPRDLARFLTNLSKNVTEYKSYFEWKNYYRVTTPTRRIICDICKLLHENTMPRKTYAISKWYSTNTCPLQHRLDYQVMYGGLNYATSINVIAV